MRRIIHLCSIGLLVSANVNCGSNDPQSASSAVQAGTGGGTGALGTWPGDTILCGTVKCANRADGNPAYVFLLLSVGKLASPCCLDADSSRCGYVNADKTACEAVPPIDTRCPEIGVPGLGGFNPCCASNGECGAGLGSFMRGCVALSDETLRKTVPAVPEPQRCDGTPL